MHITVDAYSLIGAVADALEAASRDGFEAGMNGSRPIDHEEAMELAAELVREQEE